MSEPTSQVTFTLDGVSLTVPKGTTVYEAAHKQGIDIPIFCYHDRMPPFGACRMCLVEVENMPKLQTSCTLVVTDGMVVKTHSEKAKLGREDILELLLINHPLDCPICDKGGECPLQDQTMKFGPDRSRFYEEKRRFKKPISLGPVLTLDRERCIACARCTRFGEIVSGDHALQFIDRGYKTEVGTPGEGPAESKYIGNTISICPVGALTSTVYRFRARPWDNATVDSTCTLCPVGCNMKIDTRDGEVMRTRSCENRDVNDVWLCDKGWFGYEFSENPNRLSTPLIRVSGELKPASWEEALKLIGDKLRLTIKSGKVAGWGGNVLTVEENFLFQKLFREGLGVNNIDHRIGSSTFSKADQGISSGMEISIGECEKLSSALLLGVDITEEYPVIWLRLKHGINAGAKVDYLGHYALEISALINRTILHPPGKEIEELRKQLPEFAKNIVSGSRTALFVGKQYLHSKYRNEILNELAKFKNEHPEISLNLLDACENSVGAQWAGVQPNFGPVGKKIEKTGLNPIETLNESINNGWDLLYVVGANPAIKYPSHIWKKAREKLGFLVVQDLFLNETAKEADVVLPTLCYMEKSGTFINVEGRVQKVKPVKIIPENVLSDGDIFTLLGQRLGINLSISKDFAESLKTEKIRFPEPNLAPTKIQTEKVDHNDTLRLSLKTVLFDHGVRMRHNSHLKQMSPIPMAFINPIEGNSRGVEDGDFVQVIHKENKIRAQIKFDDKVAHGTLVLPLGFPELPIQDLGTEIINGIEIDIKPY